MRTTVNLNGLRRSFLRNARAPMQRPLLWIWIALTVGMRLLPGFLGRILLQLLGGLTLFMVVLPLITGEAALTVWQILKRHLRTCLACRVTSLASGRCAHVESHSLLSRRICRVTLLVAKPKTSKRGLSRSMLTQLK